MYTHHKSCQLASLPKLLMEHIGFKTDGRFIDVGAWDGNMFSNTYMLANLGWKGLMFEPQKEPFLKCKACHKNNNVHVVNKALANYEGIAKLKLGGTISTLYDSQVSDYAVTPGFSYVRYKGKHKVTVGTLDNELYKRGWLPGIDFVSIDVEGAEMEVLKGFDLQHWKPTMLVVETHATRKERQINFMGDIVDTMMDFYGYQNIYEDTINSVYVSLNEEKPPPRRGHSLL